MGFPQLGRRLPRAHGCRVIWLDSIEPTDTAESLQQKIQTSKSRIAPYGLSDSIAPVQPDGTPLEYRTDCLGPDDATSADLPLTCATTFPNRL